jgi:tetratricopeptide (TPR) repeat protein
VLAPPVPMIGDLSRGRRTLRRAVRLWHSGQTESARRQVALSITLLSRARPCHLEELVAALHTAAGFATTLAEHDEAERMHQRCVVLLAAQPPGTQRNALLADALVRLGNGQRLLARYADAEHNLDAAAVLAHHGNPRQRAAVHNARGILAKDTGRYATAAGHYAAARNLLEPIVGADSWELATVHHNLAGLGHAQGHYVEAEEPARRALALRRSNPAADPTDVAGDATVLGAILAGLGQHEEAEELFRTAAAAWRQPYGDDHYEVAVNLHNIAATQQARGQLATAEQSFLQSLAIKVRVLGEGHPEVAALHNNLAVLQAEQNRPSEAADHYQTAVRIFERTLGPAHPMTLTCRENWQALTHHD